MNAKQFPWVATVYVRNEGLESEEDVLGQELRMKTVSHTTRRLSVGKRKN